MLDLESLEDVTVEILQADLLPISSGMVDNSWWYPAVTAPLAGKREFVCPPEHTRTLREFLRDCEKYIIIGSSGQDIDLLDLLNECAGAARIVGYVDDGGVNDVRARFETAVPHFKSLPVPPRVWNRGFKGYVVDDEFEWITYTGINDSG